MIIKSIRIKEGMYERRIVFTDMVNLIHSEKNSTGKTTLLRFILYSLGYSIPNTRNIKFEQCEAETTIYIEKKGEITLSRTDKGSIVLSSETERITYILPDQQYELHSVLFSTNNSNILDNILGVFYVDQEKGWTLLNRGTVIGSNRFNIEGLIRGLSERDCSDLIQLEAKLSKELGKYRQMFSIARYQETIEIEGGSLAVDRFDDKINIELEKLYLKRNALKKEMRRLDKAIKDNKQFSKFITDMKLLIVGPDSIEIPVSEDKIVGFNDSIDYLIAKHKLISAELSSVNKTITNYEEERESNNDQLSFWDSETMIQAFDRRIASMNINIVSIEKEIKRLEEKLANIRQKINEKLKTNNSVVDSLYRSVLKYAKELEIGDDSTIASKYLFTSNLKELSGAILHKMVFAFRLAYLIELEKNTGIKIPIILDSPSGKEVDTNNIKKMINILKRDFSDYQIIIASINYYNFESPNVIEIVNRLVEIK